MPRRKPKPVPSLHAPLVPGLLRVRPLLPDELRLLRRLDRFLRAGMFPAQWARLCRPRITEGEARQVLVHVRRLCRRLTLEFVELHYLGDELTREPVLLLLRQGTLAHRLNLPRTARAPEADPAFAFYLRADELVGQGLQTESLARALAREHAPSLAPSRAAAWLRKRFRQARVCLHHEQRLLTPDGLGLAQLLAAGAVPLWEPPGPEQDPRQEVLCCSCQTVVAIADEVVSGAGAGLVDSAACLCVTCRYKENLLLQPALVPGAASRRRPDAPLTAAAEQAQRRLLREARREQNRALWRTGGPEGYHAARRRELDDQTRELQPAPTPHPDPAPRREETPPRP